MLPQIGSLKPVSSCQEAKKKEDRLKDQLNRRQDVSRGFIFADLCIQPVEIHSESLDSKAKVALQEKLQRKEHRNQESSETWGAFWV